MSGKAWKRVRRYPKRLAREATLNYRPRPPWLVRLIGALYPDYRTRYENRLIEERRLAARYAMKRQAHWMAREMRRDA